MLNRLPRILLFLGCCAALSGCAGMQAQQREQAWAAASAELQTLIAECRAKEAGRPVARSKCVNSAEDRTVRPFIPYQDLLNLQQSYRIAVATRVANKQLSEDDAQLEFAKLAAQVSSEQLARQNGAQAVAAQQLAAQAQKQAAWGNVMAGAAAMQQATRPSSITCTRMGNMTTCN